MLSEQLRKENIINNVGLPNSGYFLKESMGTDEDHLALQNVTQQKEGGEGWTTDGRLFSKDPDNADHRLTLASPGIGQAKHFHATVGTGQKKYCKRLFV